VLKIESVGRCALCRCACSAVRQLAVEAIRDSTAPKSGGECAPPPAPPAAHASDSRFFVGGNGHAARAKYQRREP
jgi:hypothetical protein